MALTINQIKTGDGSSPVSLTFDDPVSLGSVLFVCMSTIDNGAVIDEITDTLFNGWDRVRQQGGNFLRADIWTATSVGEGTCTVTVTFDSGKSGVHLTLIEVTGLGAGNVLTVDQQNSTTAEAQTVHSHGSITTVEDVELILTCAAMAFGSESASVTPAGFDVQRNGDQQLVLTRITSSTETTDAEFETAVAANSSCVIASFYEIANPAGPARLTQQGRQIQESMPSAGLNGRLTQMARQVMYPFTCVPIPPPVTIEGCPASLPIGTAIARSCVPNI